MHPYLFGNGPLAIAHRGGAAEAPENSMRAFGRAVELGFTHLESDCRLTADGKVVLFHDPVLDRATDGRGAVAELTYAQITEATIRNPDGTPSTERVPLVADVLRTFGGARFNLDTKCDEVVEPLARVLSELDSAKRVLVTSFDRRRLRRLRALLPGWASGLARADLTWLRFASLLPGERLAYLPAGDAAQVPVCHRVAGLAVPVLDRRFVRAAQRAGLAVHAWTIDDPSEMHRLLDLGVHGIMTDRPSVLAAVLAERGGP